MVSASPEPKDRYFNPTMCQLHGIVDKLYTYLLQDSREKLKRGLERRVLGENGEASSWKTQSEFEDVSICSHFRRLAIAKCEKYMSTVSSKISTAQGGIKVFCCQ